MKNLFSIRLSGVTPGRQVLVYGPDFDYDAHMWNGEPATIIGPAKLGGAGIEAGQEYLFEVLVHGEPEPRTFHFRQFRTETL